MLVDEKGREILTGLEIFFMSFSQFSINYGIEPRPNLKYLEYDRLVTTNDFATFGPEPSKVLKNFLIVFMGNALEFWAQEKQLPYVTMFPVFKKYDTDAYNELYLPAEKGYHLNTTAAGILANELLKIIETLELRNNL